MTHSPYYVLTGIGSVRRAEALKLIYRHTSKDYKGKATEIWGADAGKKTIMVYRNGTALSLLEDLSDEDVIDRLPYCVKKEAERKIARRLKFVGITT